MPPRLFPSSFDPSDTSLRAVAVPRTYEWHSLRAALQHNGATVTLLRLPLFWQVLALVHGACSNAGSTLFVNEKENAPLGEAATRVAGADTVVTDTKDAFVFSLFLAEKNASLKNWFIVHALEETWDVPVMIGTDSNVVQEVHAYPGVPVFVQCDTLSASRQPRFHAAPGLLYDTKTGAGSFTGTDAPYAPFDRFVCKTTLSSVGICACGKDIIQK